VKHRRGKEKTNLVPKILFPVTVWHQQKVGQKMLSVVVAAAATFWHFCVRISFEFLYFL